jgi:hypothetical protein
VDVHPDVPLCRQDRLARVYAHPHRHDAAVQGPLGLLRRRERVRGSRKRDRERVALRVDRDAAVARERLPEDVTVLRQQLRGPLAMLREQPRRPLDVGEQEGDRPFAGAAAYPCMIERTPRHV